MKKISALVIALLMSISSVACGNDEVVDKPQVQQEEQVQDEPQQEENLDEQEDVERKEQIQDEDLNDEYLEQAKGNKLEEARDFVEMQLYDIIYGDEYSILDIQVITDEETNSVVMTMHLSEEEFLYMSYEEWEEIVYTWCEACFAMSNLLYYNGYEDVNFIVLIGDYNLDSPYLGIINGEVFYDVVNGIGL